MTAARMDDHVRMLRERLPDQRSGKVIFLAHCLLNENTRYLGGACRAGCVRDIVEDCVAADLGIIQLPCPEQVAWGGVLKPWLLQVFGARYCRPYVYRFRSVILPIMLCYTRCRLRRLARPIVADIVDYLTAGFHVVGIVGVDGSPSCGVFQTMNVAKAARELANLSRRNVNVAQVNAIVQHCAQPGEGMFIQAVRDELQRRGLEVPVAGHDLLAELRGERSTSFRAVLAKGLR